MIRNRQGEDVPWWPVLLGSFVASLLISFVVVHLAVSPRRPTQRTAQTPDGPLFATPPFAVDSSSTSTARGVPSVDEEREHFDAAVGAEFRDDLDRWTLALAAATDDAAGTTRTALRTSARSLTPLTASLIDRLGRAAPGTGLDEVVDDLRNGLAGVAMSLVAVSRCTDAPSCAAASSQLRASAERAVRAATALEDRWHPTPR